MNHTNKELLRRLHIVQGHLKKVAAMVEDDAYCIDVLNQSKAVQQALRKVDELVLDRHLRSCAVKHMRQGKTDTAVNEIMSVFKRI